VGSACQSPDTEEGSCRYTGNLESGAAAAAFAAQLGRPSSEPRTFAEDLILAITAARILGDKRAADQLMDAAAAGFGPAWSPAVRAWRSLRGTQYKNWPPTGPWEIRLDNKAERVLETVLARFEKERVSIAHASAWMTP
jgi:hypothetical protein